MQTSRAEEELERIQLQLEEDQKKSVEECKMLLEKHLEEERKARQERENVGLMQRLGRTLDDFGEGCKFWKWGSS